MILAASGRCASAFRMWLPSCIGCGFFGRKGRAADHCDLADFSPPSQQEAKTLSAAEVAALPKQGRLVQITAIKSLRGVNALASDQRLPIRTRCDQACGLYVTRQLSTLLVPTTQARDLQPEQWRILAFTGEYFVLS